jgi:hypothetical protein
MKDNDIELCLTVNGESFNYAGGSGPSGTLLKTWLDAVDNDSGEIQTIGELTNTLKVSNDLLEGKLSNV